MDTQQNRASLFSRKHPHQRGLSDTSSMYSFCSVSASPSEKLFSLKIDHLKTESSQYSSIDSPQSTLRSQKEVHRPISLVIIEKYFSDICQSIASKESIDRALLAKALTMQEVLKDCLTAVPDISMQFYVLMASALKEIQQIYSTQDESLFSPLAKKLIQIASMIEDGKFTSEVDRVNTQPSEEIAAVHGLRNISKELNVRVTRVTARILNLWKRILTPQREAAVISCCFLLLYCEVDKTLKISPTSRIPADKAVNLLKDYLNNPGFVVTVIRKTQEYIDKEMISVETFKRIHDLLEKITIDQVKAMDKTLTGFTLYDMLIYAMMYYQEFVKEHYNLDVYEKKGEIQAEFQEDNEVQMSPAVKLKKSPTRPREELKVKEESKNMTKLIKPANRLPARPIISQSKPQLTSSPSAKSIKTQRLIKKPESGSPPKHFDFQSKTTKNDSPSKNIFIPNKLNTSDLIKPSNIKRESPARTRGQPHSSKNSTASPSRQRTDVDQMQYQQYIDEKFRHFLIDKLQKEGEKLENKGIDSSDIKLIVEIHAGKYKESWIEEFEKGNGNIKFNATKKFMDNNIYNGEIIKAQRQLDIILRYVDN